MPKTDKETLLMFIGELYVQFRLNEQHAEGLERTVAGLNAKLETLEIEFGHMRAEREGALA